MDWCLLSSPTSLIVSLCVLFRGVCYLEVCTVDWCLLSSPTSLIVSLCVLFRGVCYLEVCTVDWCLLSSPTSLIVSLCVLFRVYYVLFRGMYCGLVSAVLKHLSLFPCVCYSEVCTVDWCLLSSPTLFVQNSPAILQSGSAAARPMK